MRLFVLSAAIAATVLGALPTAAEVVVRAGEGGVAIHERDRDNYHHNNWRHHHAECREVRVRTRLDNGRMIYKTRRTCD